MTELKIYFTSIKGRRESNEDRHNVVLNINSDDPSLNPINLFGIYDGHGGSKVSQYLESNIPSYYMNKNFTPPFNEEFHKKVFQIIQSELLKNSFGYTNGSTCLLNLMYKYKENLYMNVANLGDSRMTIIYSDNSSKAITKDHKPDDSVELARLEDMGGSVYKDTEGVYRIGDLSLSRAFGDGDNAPYISQVPDTFYIKITPDIKCVVMACDGLWDVIESEDLGKLIGKLTKSKPSKSSNIAIDLANWALEAGSSDNVSVIVIELEHHKKIE